MGHEKMNPRSRIAIWGLRIAVLALLLFVAGVVLNRFDIVSFKVVIPMLGLSALLGGIAVLVSAAGILRTMLSARSGTRYAIAGLVIGLLVAAPLGQTILAGAKLPRIHDITTDLSNPPQFDAVAALRSPDANSLDRALPADLAGQQEAAYPDLAPLAVEQHPGKVFEAAEDVARKMGWDVVAVTPETGVIEATATTRLMNFKDDIVIRVTETETGALVDVRSASRVGESDLGANANRIRSFLHELKQSLS